MGQYASFLLESKETIICPICIRKKHKSKLSGELFILNETQYKCNKCYTIFNKIDIL
jgi:hypothetical protein